MKSRLSYNEQGFTIIELLIATTVFSLVLILLTTGTLAVTRLYYKGVISSQSQTVARNILDQVSQSLQFSGAQYTALTTVGDEHGFCIGSSQFSYNLPPANQVAGQPLPTPALLERTVGNNNSCFTYGLDSISNPSTSPASTELLPDHMSLNNLDVSESATDPTLFCVSIRVLYGDSDLFVGTSAKDSCGQPYTQFSCSGALDNLIAGQFCAVSGLDTYVQERVPQSSS
jgi:prepilin-type N-terminal cleavage/methylation domain-containing protein